MHVPLFIIHAAAHLALQLGYPETAATAPSGVDPIILLPKVEELVHSWDVPRNTLMVLLFSGQGRAAHIAFENGYPASTFDIIDDTHQDITSPVGLLYAAFLVMSIVVGGTLWLSPSCSSWLSYMSRFNFGRGSAGAAVLGNDSKPAVKEANTTALFTSWLIVLAHVRGVKFGYENPLNSLHFHHACVLSGLLITKARRLVTSAGAFGADTQKTLEFYHTFDDKHAKKYLKGTIRKARECLKARGNKKTLAVKKGKWTTGKRQAMRESQAYPEALAQGIFNIALKTWETWLLNH